MSLGRVQLEGDLLRLDVGGVPMTFFIEPAVVFEAVDGDAPDRYGLMGSVKSVRELAQIAAEHFETSVVIHDMAYTVRQGFLAIAVGYDGMELQLDSASWARLTSILSQYASV